MSRTTTAALPAAALALAVTLSPLASRISNAQPGEPPALAPPPLESVTGFPGGGSATGDEGSSLSSPDALHPSATGRPAPASSLESGGVPPPSAPPTPGLAQNTPPAAHPPVPPNTPVPPVPTPDFGPVPTPPHPPSAPSGYGGPGGHGGRGAHLGRPGRINPTPATPPAASIAGGGFPPPPTATELHSAPPAPVPGLAQFPSGLPPAEDSPLLTDNRFDAIFDGGLTASDVAEYLSAKIPGLNVMLPGNAGDIVLPDMQLKDVNLREFMAAINAASDADMANGNPGYRLTPIPGAPNIIIFQRIQPSAPVSYAAGSVAAMPGAPPMEGGNIRGGGGGRSPAAGASGMDGGAGDFSGPYHSPGKKQTQFFDLSAILKNKDLKVDDVTTAIRTAWSSTEGGKMPPEGALKFHQETRLLIVTATPEYMQSASSIVNLLLRRTEPSDSEREQELNAAQQKMMMVEEARMRAEEARMHAERERQTVEEKNREVREKLQARITDLELELVKLRQQQEQQQPGVQAR